LPPLGRRALSLAVASLPVARPARAQDAFTAAPTLAERQRVAAEMQQIVYERAIAMRWGQFAQPAAHRAQLQNLIPSAIPLFWNVEKR
jgi:peptide/nickel transport system substrate-binding protein